MSNAHALWDTGLAAIVHPPIIRITDFDTMAEMADHIGGLSVDTEVARHKRECYFEYASRVQFYATHRQIRHQVRWRSVRSVHLSPHARWRPRTPRTSAGPATRGD